VKQRASVRAAAGASQAHFGGQMPSMSPTVGVEGVSLHPPVNTVRQCDTLAALNSFRSAGPRSLNCRGRVVVPFQRSHFTL
jgi:hypothetical protein